MNDLYDSLPSTRQNDKLALLYKCNYENQVCVKTAVGKTKRVDMPRIVMQGGSWGPIQCSNSIDNWFGKNYYQIALRLREAMFLNSILTNSEIWYGITKSEIEELESLDRLLLRRIMSLPITTCKEALHLETGSQDIETILKGSRIKYLQYLVKCDKKSMQYKFFKAQWDFPVRGDWTQQVREDLEDFGIREDLKSMEEKSKNAFKRMVHLKCKEYAMEKFRTLKMSHSKMKNLFYSELELKQYLKLKNVNVEESKILLSWRLRMAKFGANYGQSQKLCPLCSEHEDCQEKCFNQCRVIRDAIQINNKYEEIFSDQPSKEIATILRKITSYLEDAADFSVHFIFWRFCILDWT